MSAAPFAILPADWNAHRDALRAIRRIVFIEEQGVPEALEWDELDEHCRHVLALAADGRAIGTGRLTPDGRIGRMAVLREWRDRGVGSAILQYLLLQARKAGHATAQLHAQTHALPFYARHGFTATGPEFLEANIPHRVMCINLAMRSDGPQAPSR
jgi:predicted GNAT family N-acyltransferase